MVSLAMMSPPDDVLHHQVTRSYRQPAAFRGGRRASAFVASVAAAGGGSAVDGGDDHRDGRERVRSLHPQAPSWSFAGFRRSGSASGRKGLLNTSTRTGLVSPA